MHTRHIALFTATLLLLSAVQAHPSHQAHVHGVGKLDVVLDGQSLSLHLDSPLVNLLGFEHRAQSSADRQAVQDMSQTLRHAAAIFVTSPTAACRLSRVKLAATALEPSLLGEADAPKTAINATFTTTTASQTRQDHSDLDADFVFHCAAPQHLQQIDVKLFDAFKNFVQIDVQLVTDRRQSAVKLTPLSSSLAIPQ